MFKFCWHRFEDKVTQRTVNLYFGFAGSELPGIRITQACKKCGKVRYMSLNLMMPNKYLYMEEVWKK